MVLFALPLFVSFIVLAVVAAAAVRISLFNKNSNGGGRPLPSPPSLPIIGHLHLLAGAQPLALSMACISAKYGPLVGLKLGQVPTLIVSSSTTAREVMKAHEDMFSSRPATASVDGFSYGFKDVAFSPADEGWRQRKKLCTTHILGNGRVHLQAPLREQQVASMVEHIRKAGQAGAVVDMSEIIYSLTMGLICLVMTGAGEGGKISVMRHLNEESMQVLGGANAEDFFPFLRFAPWLFRSSSVDRARRNFDGWDALLDELIDEHSTHADTHAASFVDVLLSLWRGDDGQDAELKLTGDVVKAIIKDMFTAGSETTSNTIEWAMAELVKNPRCMSKLQEEVRSLPAAIIRTADLAALPFLKAVLKETVRLHPPAPLIPRECAQDCVLAGGYRIAKGTRVFINAWAIGREPESWDAPAEFRPERFVGSAVDFRGNDFQFIPFGSGRRSCPGLQFGTTTAELALANLVCHFDWELPGGMAVDELDMAAGAGLSMPRKTRLVLVPRLAGGHQRRQSI